MSIDELNQLIDLCFSAYRQGHSDLSAIRCKLEASGCDKKEIRFIIDQVTKERYGL